MKQINNESTRTIALESYTLPENSAKNMTQTIALTLRAGILAAIMVACLFLSSCDKETYPAAANPTCEVSIGVGGEFAVSANIVPMRGDDNSLTLYLINIFRRKLGSNDSWECYASGVFDNAHTDQMKTSLESDGYEYRFEAGVYVESGNDRLHLPGKYYFVDGFAQELTNRFEENTVLNFGRGDIWAEYVGGTTYLCHPEIAKYYGLLEGYQPQDGDEVCIELVSANFGLNVTVNAPASGSFTVDMTMSEISSNEEFYWGPYFLNYFTPKTDTYQTGDKVFCFADAKAVYNSVKAGETYSQEITIEVLWTKSFNPLEKYEYTTTVPVERNCTTVLDISVGSQEGTPLVLKSDSSPFSTQSYQISMNEEGMSATPIHS